MKPLTRVRKICLALPEATEKEAWGAPTFRVRDKMFAIYAENHHGDGRIALWCNAPVGAQQVLVHAEPDRFFVPPYMGPRGWIGLLLDQLDDDAVAQHAREGYRKVAPKKLLALLPED
ncbi:MAG: MmcQ/YjbR family DNA-binding protein [Planctomycetota bacterium]